MALTEIAELQDLATKDDLAGLESRVTGLFERVMRDWRQGSTSTSEVVGIGSSMINSITSNPVVGSIGLTGFAPTVLNVAHCRSCGSEERATAMFCSMCGNRLR